MAKISVTQEDIRNGKKSSSNRCPVVLALNRHIGGHSIDFSIGFCITRKTGNKKQFFRLPKEVLLFIILFDAGKPVSPFEFEIGEQVT